MAAFAASVLLLTGAAAALLGIALRWPRPRIAALVLVALLPNAGNFGLPVTRFAFGDEGLARAGVFFITASVLTYTVGVFVASLGRRGPGEALRGLLRVPTLYAVAAGFVIAGMGWSLPGPVDRTVSLLADACIPVFLIVLGMQLRSASWRETAATGRCGSQPSPNRPSIISTSSGSSTNASYVPSSFRRMK